MRVTQALIGATGFVVAASLVGAVAPSWSDEGAVHGQGRVTPRGDIIPEDPPPHPPEPIDSRRELIEAAGVDPAPERGRPTDAGVSSWVCAVDGATEFTVVHEYVDEDETSAPATPPECDGATWVVAE